MPAQAAGGVQITATDGGAGNRSTSATTGCPCSSRYFGLTGHTASNPPSSTRDHTIAPILPARDDAPTTATDLGWNNASRWRTVTSAPCGNERRPDRHAARAGHTPIDANPKHRRSACGCLYAERPTVRPTSTLASWACNTSTEAIAARRPSTSARRKRCRQRDAASASSKVRIYRSHGETLRELHGATRQHAKGDRNSQHACTTRMAQAIAHALRNCAVVYRNSPRYPGESQRIRKTGSVNCAASQFNTPSGIAPEMHTKRCDMAFAPSVSTRGFSGVSP